MGFWPFAGGNRRRTDQKGSWVSLSRRELKAGLPMYLSLSSSGEQEVRPVVALGLAGLLGQRDRQVLQLKEVSVSAWWFRNLWRKTAFSSDSALSYCL
jgi:hypothetical protein